MSKLILLALLVPTLATAQDDPDDFAVPTATPLEVVPLDGGEVEVQVEVEGAAETEVEVQTSTSGKFGGARSAEAPLAVPVEPAPSTPPPPAEESTVVETSTSVGVGGSVSRQGRSVSVTVEGRRDRARAEELPPYHATSAGSDERPLAIAGNAPPPREPAPAPAPRPRVERQQTADVVVVDEVQDEDRKRFFGFWGGMQGARTRIDGDRTLSGSADLGFHLGRWFVFSGTVGSINDSYAGGEIGYVGIRHGVVLKPNAMIHPRLDLLWGVAASSEDPGRPFNIAEPRVALELKLREWGRLEATAGYRIIASAPVPNARLSGPTLGLGMRVGWF